LRSLCRFKYEAASLTSLSFATETLFTIRSSPQQSRRQRLCSGILIITRHAHIHTQHTHIQRTTRHDTTNDTTRHAHIHTQHTHTHTRHDATPMAHRAPLFCQRCHQDALCPSAAKTPERTAGYQGRPQDVGKAERGYPCHHQLLSAQAHASVCVCVCDALTMSYTQ
jgi:hypothetical protein